jgi:FkbM family methyltransferase
MVDDIGRSLSHTIHSHARRARRRLARSSQPGDDRLSMRQLRHLLGPSCRTMLEIGANNGVDSLRLYDTIPEATLHCFEPDPRAFATLRRNTRRSPIAIHQLAIGNHDGTTTFHQSGGQPPGAATDRSWDKSGSIRAPKLHLEQHPWCTFDTTITVPIARLDTWAHDHGITTVDFIWADVQGAEIDLIEGGTTTLAHTRYFYTEYSERELYEGQVGLSELLALLPGWDVHTVYPDDVLLVNRAFTTGH